MTDTTTARQPGLIARLAQACGQVPDRLGEWAGEHLGYAGMNRRDRRAWAAARSLADIGVLTRGWLYGELETTPTHCGPPEEETRPYIRVLAGVNLAGFVTDNSQAGASGTWGQCAADVSGLLAEGDLTVMREVIASSPLVIGTWCRGREHHGHKGWLSCPRRDLDDFTAGACPAAADEVAAAWHVTITDPVPDRNTELWPALERFAGRKA